MRLFIGIAILFISQVVSAQAKLNIYFENCKTDEIDSNYSLNLYKDKRFLKTLHLDDTVLNNLDKGFYTIEYKSFFGEIFVDTINITKDTSYWASIRTDDIKDYAKAYKKITDSITTNKGIVIEFVAYGCFHWESQKLRIFKKGPNYFATLYPEVRIREESKGFPQTNQLSELQMKDLFEFQLQSYLYADGGGDGGTESVWCTYKYKNSHIKIIDSSDTESMIKLFDNLLKAIYGRTRPFMIGGKTY